MPALLLGFDPLGYVSASGNGSNGVVITQSGTSGAYSLLAGIREAMHKVADFSKIEG